MIFIEEMENYLYYCKFQKELDIKTIKACEADLRQFASGLKTQKIEEIRKEEINIFWGRFKGGLFFCKSIWK